MEWKTIAGILPSDVHYEAYPAEGVHLRIEPERQNDWPAFRWIVHLDVGGRIFHHEETAVDLAAAKHRAEKFLRFSLSALNEK